MVPLCCNARNLFENSAGVPSLLLLMRKLHGEGGASPRLRGSSAPHPSVLGWLLTTAAGGGEPRKEGTSALLFPVRVARYRLLLFVPAGKEQANKPKVPLLFVRREGAAAEAITAILQEYCISSPVALQIYDKHISPLMPLNTK